MISTRNLRRVFKDVIAVDDLNITVERGSVFGLVGPDGAGKTTTMRLLTGILPATSGEATVASVDVLAEPEKVKTKIGYMSQRFGLYPDLSVMENVLFYADIYGVPKRGRMEKIEKLLGFSNLSPFKDRHAGDLSGGMKQKLGLACALIHTPEILFLDEPTNGVDPVSRRDFWRILYQLVRDGMTLFVSTAYLDEAERCGKLALLHQGKLLAVGSPDQIKAQMKQTVWEIRLKNPRQTAAKLRDTLPECSVNLFGETLHLVFPEGRQGIEATIRNSLSGDDDATSVRQISPSLEDVFVSIVSQQKQAA